MDGRYEAMPIFILSITHSCIIASFDCNIGCVVTPAARTSTAKKLLKDNSQQGRRYGE